MIGDDESGLAELLGHYRLHFWATGYPMGPLRIIVDSSLFIGSRATTELFGWAPAHCQHLQVIRLQVDFHGRLVL